MASNIVSTTPSKARLAVYTSANAYAAIPFPPEIAPTDASFWDNFTDDDILAMPAHVAVHCMRTIAQNGAQVISPRQVPSTTIVKRVSQDSAGSFIHVAGSDASVTARWPVPPGSVRPVMEDMEDEPIRKHGEALAVRSPATTKPLVSGLERVASPIQRAWIKARAACDFAAREEVGGDAEALAAAYEKVFGAPAGSLMKDPGLTATGLIDYREHAIVVDNKLARQLAPVQARRVLSVAVGASDAAAFGPFRGFDWTCARVVAETKFRLTVSNEGLSLLDVACPPNFPVGLALTAASARPGNVLVYHPTGACAWSYDPVTFAVKPVGARNMASRMVNAQVAKELAKGAEFASPIAAAASFKAAVSWIATAITTTTTGDAADAKDALASFRTVMSSSSFSTKSISKTIPGALRAELFTALESAPLAVACKMMRAIVVVREAVEACRPDLVLDKNAVESLAHRMVALDSHINVHMLQAAAYRGKNAEDWFSALSREIPKAYRPEKVGTKGWAVIIAHHMLKPPDKKWASLIKAMRSRTIDTMGKTLDKATDVGVVGAEGEQRVDTVRFRAERVVASIRTMYGANYDGAALGSAVVARMADAAGMSAAAASARVAAAGWTFRRDVVMSLKVRVCAEEPAASSVFAVIAVPKWVAESGKEFHVALSTDFRKPYRSWADKMRALGVNSAPAVNLATYGRATVLTTMLEVEAMDNYADEFLDADAEKVSAMPWLKYAAAPSTLVSAVTSNMTWAEKDCRAAVASALDDIKAADKAIEASHAEGTTEAPVQLVVDKQSAAQRMAAVDAQSEAFFREAAAKVAATQANGWFWLAQCDPEDAAYIGEEGATLPGYKVLIEDVYASVEDFLDAFDDLMRARDMAAAANDDVFAT